MKRVIVDYSKLTNEILNLLLEKFPDGYDDSNIIRFRNAQNELIEAIEVRTEDTIYLVKVSTKLASRLEKFEEEDEDLDAIVEPIDAIKDIEEDDDLGTSDDEESDDEDIDADGGDADADDDEDDEEMDSDDIEDDEDDDEDER